MSAIDLHSRPMLAPKVRFQIDAVRGEPVLLYPEGLLILNATAQEIVARCDGKTTVLEIIRFLGEEYDADEAALQRDVIETLSDLRQRNLILFTP